MKLLDLNVLIYAHRRDFEQHQEYASWLGTVASGGGAFGASELVLSGFVRVVTNPRIYRVPTSVETALNFVASLRGAPNYVQLAPGLHHWRIFEDLLRRHHLAGNDVPDAYHAALAL